MKIRALGISAAALFAAGTFLAAQPAFTQPAGPPPGGAPPPGAPGAPPPGGMSFGAKNPAAAPAGVYKLDLEHHSIIARVNHRGFSFNVLRFGATKGTLNWDPQKPEAITLDVTASAKTLHEPIVYVIQPETMLKTAQFPEIRFVSTAVRKTGAMTADIEGNLTLAGVTKPAVIHAELVGAHPTTVGFTGTMDVNFPDFGGAATVGLVKIGLDAEFKK